MPYRERNDCVQELRNGKWVNLKCYPGNRPKALKYLAALEANVSDAKETEAVEIEKAGKNPDDFAVVPDPEKPSGWKLDISDDTHVADAITALTSGFRGNKVQLSSDERAQAKKRIRAKINQMPDGAKKDNLISRLEKVKEVDDGSATLTTGKAFTGMLDQTEVNYIPLSTSRQKACANCRWFMVGGCFIVENDPEPILPTGYCDRWETPPQPEAPEVEPIPVTLVPSQDLGDNMGMPMMGKEGRKLNSINMKRLTSFYNELKDMLTEAGYELKERINPTEPSHGFDVFKDANGVWHWHAAYTNNYQDRDDEIITAKAHVNYINRVDMGLVEKPTLRIWHIKGSDHGKADLLWYTGEKDGSTPLVVHAVGHFDDSEIATKALAYLRKHKMKNSHGFVSAKWAFKEGVYSDYNTFEISWLPPSAAANPFTSFQEIKEMALTDSKKELLKQMGLENKIPEFEAADTNVKELASEAEAVYKQYGDFADTEGGDESDDGEKDASLKSLVLELIETQNELVEFGRTQVKAEKAHQAVEAGMKQLIANQDKKIARLEKQLNLKPQRASEADETELDDEEAKELEGELPQGDDAYNLGLRKMFGPAIKAGGNS